MLLTLLTQGPHGYNDLGKGTAPSGWGGQIQLFCKYISLQHSLAHSSLPSVLHGLYQ